MKHTAIEPLEARIAPAAVFTYTDFDGDLVSVKSSKGTLDDLAAAATINNGVLLRLDLSDPKFQGAAISITAQPKPGEIGDGLASVGFIDATNVDLASVTIDGDLGRIIAGDTIRTTPGIKSLKVGSLGALDVTTQQAGGNLVSKVEGSVGSILVAGDWMNASFTVLGDPAVAKDGQIGRVSIGGTMTANNATPGAAQLSVEDGIGSFTLRGDLEGNAIESGAVFVGGEIGKLFIGGSIIGGAGENSGRISAASIKQGTVNGDLRGGMGTSSATISAGKLGSLTVGGSLIGAGFFSARIGVNSDTGSIRIGSDLLGSNNLGSGTVNLGGKLGSISVGGSVHGGSGSSTGCINVVGDIGSVSIDGDLIGGAAQSTGDVTSKGSIERVVIGGNVVGGSVGFSGRIVAGAESLPGGALGKVSIGGSLLGGSGGDAGVIFATDRIGSVVIADDVIAGANFGAGSIRAGFDIGNLTIGGNVDSLFPELPFSAQALFVAGGSKTPSAGKDVAFGKVSIGGSMTRGVLLAGYSAIDLTPTNPDAQIGTVMIKGDFVASSIVAGVKNDDGDPTHFYFGDADDQTIGGGNAATVASIAKIVVGGTVRGTNAGVNNTDFYAIAAEQVKSLVIGGTSIPLNAGAHNDPTGGIGNGFLGYTGDLRVREI